MPVTFVPPSGWPSGSTTVDRQRSAGVDLEVQRRRLGLGVEVDLGQDVVIARREQLSGQRVEDR